MVFDAPVGSPAAAAASSALDRNPLSVILTHRFARQVLTGRWFTVFASLLIMASSGATYIFGSYSGALKSTLGYDQRTLNTVSFFKDLGANLGVLPGLVNEVAPPWAVLAAGADMNLGGYLMVYLAVSGRTSTPPVWLVCVYFFMGANSQAFANTGALVTCVRNFPETRGVVIGILKGFVGLSGAVYAQLYLAFYGGEDPEALLLLVAVVPAAVSLTFVGVVRYMPRPRRGGQEGSADPFFCFLYLSIALACFLLVMIVVQQRVELSRHAHALATTPLLVLLFMPLCVVVKQEYKIRRERDLDAALLLRDGASSPVTVTVDGAMKEKQAEEEEEKAEENLKAESSPRDPVRRPCVGSRLGRCMRTMFRPPARGEDHTILQAATSADMLVLFAAAACGVGGTLTAIDNMGQIGQALGYTPKSVNTLVALISIWNYAGRVTAGYASEALLASRHRVPRPVMLTLVLLLACAGHVLIALGNAPGEGWSLYVASVITGFCFGAQWPLVFAVISEVFGLRRYSTLHNLGGLASPVGTYVLNVRVAGRLYDAAARRQGNGSGGACVGAECYRTAFLVITGATAFGAAVSLVLVWRTWAFYRRGDIYARFREEGEEAREEGRLPVAGKQTMVAPEQDREEEETFSGGAVNYGSNTKG